MDLTACVGKNRKMDKEEGGIVKTPKRPPLTVILIVRPLCLSTPVQCRNSGIEAAIDNVQTTTWTLLATAVHANKHHKVSSIDISNYHVPRLIQVSFNALKRLKLFISRAWYSVK